MRATQILKDEHRLILQVLEAIEERSGASQEADDGSDWMSDAIEFIEVFVEGAHFHKEESELFPRMEAGGVAEEGGPIGRMLHEHGMLRQQMQTIEAAETVAQASEALANYAAKLRAHIGKENDFLFWMADHVLDPADNDRLVSAFESFDADHFGADGKEKYAELAAELAGSDADADGPVEHIDLALATANDRLSVWATDDVQIMRVRLAPGEALPHHEANSNVVLLPLHGKLRVDVPHQSEGAGAGKALSVPFGTPMDVMNDGEDVLTFLVLKTPHPRQMAGKNTPNRNPASAESETESSSGCGNCASGDCG